MKTGHHTTVEDWGTVVVDALEHAGEDDRHDLPPRDVAVLDPDATELADSIAGDLDDDLRTIGVRQ